MTGGQLLGLGILLSVNDQASGPLSRITNALGITQQSAEGVTNTMNNLESSMGAVAMGVTYAGKQLIDGGMRVFNTYKNLGTQVVKTGAQFENYRKTLKALYKDETLAQEKASWAMNLASTTPFEVQDVMQALIGMKAIGVEADSTFSDANGEMRSFLEYVGDLAALRPDVGMQGVMIGVRNYLGGEAMSINKRLDIDVEEVLGRKMGATTEARIQDMVDLSKQLASGLMKELEGTWDQIISNLQDQKTRFFLAIGDAGMFDGIKTSLKKVADFINGITDDELAVMGKNLADIFTSLWEPIDKIADVLVVVLGYIKEALMTNPVLVKTIVQLTLLAGTILTVVGGLAVFGGAIGFLKIGLMQLGATFSGFLIPIAILTTALSVLVRLWNDDFLGLKTNTLDFIQKAITFAGLLFDAWDYNMSDENFAKAQELGLLSLIETILDCKMKAEAFFEGFVAGVKQFIQGFMSVAKPIISVVTSILEGLGLLEKSNKAFDTSGWEKFGQVVAWVVGLFGVFMAGSKIVSFISMIAGGFSMVSGAIGTVISALTPLLAPLLLNPITLGVMAIVGAFALLCAVNEDVKQGFMNFINNIKDALMGIVSFIVNVFKGNWQGAWDDLCNVVVNVFKGLVNLVSPFINMILDMVNSVIRKINSIKISTPDWGWLPDSIQNKSWSPSIPEINTIPQLNTGGYIKDEGISMLHPNEVVINDPLTRKLKSFLDGNNPNTSNPNPVGGGAVSSSQSLVVEKGAIVIEVSNGSTADAEDIADKVIKKIEKKAKIKKLVSYQ